MPASGPPSGIHAESIGTAPGGRSTDAARWFRVLDFGADKSPPFLAGTESRGVQLLLDHPDALRDQLRAILRCGASADVRVMLPMIESPAPARRRAAAALELVARSG